MGKEHPAEQYWPKLPDSTRLMPLSMVHRGKQGAVRFIYGQNGIRRLLRDIGFVENTAVAVISENDGSVIVRLKGSRLAIDKAVAERIITEISDGDDRFPLA